MSKTGVVTAPEAPPFPRRAEDIVLSGRVRPLAELPRRINALQARQHPPFGAGDGVARNVALRSPSLLPHFGPTRLAILAQTTEQWSQRE